MITTRALAALAARRRRRGQGGYALLVVLFVILLVGLLVVALLGLSFTTSAFSTSQEVREDQIRAADAALETATAEIAGDPTGNLGLPVESSSGQIVPTTDCDLPDELAFGTPAVNVAITCEPVAGTSGTLIGAPDPGAAAPVDFVRVLGDELNGPLDGAWRTTASTPWPWLASFPGVGPLQVGTFNQTIDGTVPNAAFRADPTVVHTGDAPLNVTANLDVRKETVALRNPTVVDGTPYDSAVSVTGQYRQGDAGLLENFALANAPGLSATDPGRTCGVLDPRANVNPWRQLGAAVRAGAGVECSNAEVAARTWNSPGVVPSPPVQWTPDLVESLRIPVRTEFGNQRVPNNCAAASGGQLFLSAGAYTRDDTRRLNDLLSGTIGNCRNVTFVFAPGDYWFDADNGTTGPLSGANRHALVFGSPDARYIFGTVGVSGTPTDADFPGACTTPGVTITLSPRTSIRHQAGRLDICGEDGERTPAVYQSADANLGWTATPRPLSGSSPLGQFANPNGVLARGGDVARLFMPCLGPSLTWLLDWLSLEILNAACDYERAQITVRDVGGASPAGPAPIDSAQVYVSARSTFCRDFLFNLFETCNTANGEGATTTISVVTEGPNRIRCSVTYPDLPDSTINANASFWDNNQLFITDTVAYELLDPTRPSCYGRITDRAQLVNADITVRFTPVNSCSLGICGDGSFIAVDHIELRVPSPLNLGSFSNFGGPNFGNPQFASPSTNEALTAGLRERNDGRFVEWFFDCGFANWRCRAEWFFSPTTRASPNFRVTGIDDLFNPDLSPTADPAAQLRKAVVTIAGEATRSNGPDASTEIQVVNSSIPTGRCTVRVRGVPTGADRGQMKLIDLLEPVGTHPGVLANDCAGRLTTAGQLVGAEMRVYTNLHRVDCGEALFDIQFGLCDDWGIRLDHFSVSTTTSAPVDPVTGVEQTYQGPVAPMLVTVNDDASAADDAVFRVAGQVVLPRTDLDVVWAGNITSDVADVPEAGSIVTLPVFQGRGVNALTVSSIGSRQLAGAAVGVLCCEQAKPAERSVEIQARLGDHAGPLLGRATLLISDVSSNPFRRGTWSPGQRVTIRDWQLCAGASTDEAQCAQP